MTTYFNGVYYLRLNLYMDQTFIFLLQETSEPYLQPKYAANESFWIVPNTQWDE